MICSHCGNQIEEGAAFCTRCGNPIMNNNQTIQMTPMNQAPMGQTQVNQPEQKRSLGPIIAIAVGGVVAVLLLIVIVVFVFFRPMETSKTTTSRNAKKTEGKSRDREEEIVEIEEQELTVQFEEVIYGNVLPNVKVLVMEGYDNPYGEILYEAVSEEDGQAQLEIPEGEYTLRWETDGYCGGYENLTVADSELNYTKRMLPSLETGNAYVLVEWESDQDLDLCVYNAKTDEYISIMKATDSQGNFLYSDNDGQKGYELIRLANYMSGVYTIYIRDDNSLLQALDSNMSEQGLRISFYTTAGLVYQKEASRDERAGLWSPFYVYDGQVMELDEYIYDMTNYEWAVRDKNDPSIFLNEQAMLAYEAFLHREMATDKGYYLTDYLAEREEFDTGWFGYIDSIQYGYLDVGADGVQELLVTYKGVGIDYWYNDYESTDNIILKYDGTTLRECYRYETWSRGGASVSYYGVVRGGGSGGASYYLFDATVIDADGTMVELYTAEQELSSEQLTGFGAYIEPLYSDQVNFQKDGVTPPEGGCSSYKIDDKYYLVYNDDEYSAPYEEFQEFYAGYGYQTYKQEEIDEIIVDYAQQQGIELWMLEDETQPEMHILEKEWYSEYVAPETLELSSEEIKKMSYLGYALFSSCGSDMSENTSKYFYSWEIQEAIKENMSYFLAYSDILYNYREEDVYEIVIDEEYSYCYYKVKEEKARAVIKDLFGFEYDLQQLGKFTTFEDIYFNTYYEDGYVVVYMYTGVGSGRAFGWGEYQGMYKEDREWKLEFICIDEIGGVKHGAITLYLNPWKNSYGYQIIGCDIETKYESYYFY